MGVNKDLKKIIALSFLLSIFLLAACGDKTNSTESSDDGKGNQKPIQVIMTHENTTTHWKHEYMQKFADLLKEKSNGKLEPLIYPAGQLYTDKDAIAALGTGSVHITWPVTVNVEQLNEAYGLLALPFAIPDEVMLGEPEYKKEMNDLLTSMLEDKNIKNLGLLRTSEALFISKDIRMKSLEDLENLKVRVTGGQATLDILDKLKITAIGMPSSEMTTALSQGTIDAIFTSPDGWASIVADAAKYGAIIPKFYVATYTMVADNKWFDGLPKDLQNIIVDAANEVSKEQWQYGIDMDAEALEKVKAYGTMDTFSEAELDKIAERVKPTIERFKEKFPEEFNTFIEIQQKYGVDWPRK